jgi:DNA-directed RNA polymerase specialized sigma24 family protein
MDRRSFLHAVLIAPLLLLIPVAAPAAVLIRPDGYVGFAAEDLVALDGALDRLKAVDPQAVELVHLRYFAGLSVADAAEMLGISPRTADRVWAFARAWLHREIAGQEGNSEEK